MAERKTISKALGMLAIVLQDKKISREFIKIYQDMLGDLPDEVLLMATRECLLRCRFFPTIAELRERADPILQMHNLSQRKLIEADQFAKCRELVTHDRKNYPHCKIEFTGECDHARTGACKKWDVRRV